MLAHGIFGGERTVVIFAAAFDGGANLKLRGKKVLVYGMGISGQSACRLLHAHGACVSIFDDESRFANIFCFEKNPLMQKYDMIVVSPGIKVIGNQLISHFIMTDTPIISELDLGWIFSHGKVVGITGTNGKTTVTSLVGEICKKAGKKTFVCGNIGLPISAVADQTDKDSVTVCEVSNFQLELSRYFDCDIACMLNLAPDHLDRHGSFEEYCRVKKKIFTGKRSQKLVLNFDDELARGIDISKKTMFFSKKLISKGVFVKNNAIFSNKTKIVSLNDVPLFGEKNIENVLAAVAIAVKLKIKPAVIRSGIVGYRAPAHRLEYLGQVDGADVFDDSKATNVASAVAAISSLGEKGLVLLIGGQNKDCAFDDIFNRGLDFETICCFGQAGKEIFDCASGYGYSPLIFPTMKAAAHFARANAAAGQKILLAPACASFDEFASYAVRGEVYKEIMFGSYDKIEMSQ